MTSDGRYVLVPFVLSHPNPVEPETPAAQHRPFYIGILHEMIEIGVGLMRLAQSQAEGEVAGGARSGDAAVDSTGTFDRVSRSVRRSIMLADKLAEPAVAVEPGMARAAARRQIIRAVEDAIERDAPRDEEDALHGEFLERLDRPELEDEIDQRPIDQIIAEICRDLGIASMPGARVWKRRTPEDVALLWERASVAPCGHDGVAGDARIRGP